MPTPSVERARGWLGRVMFDRDSNRIGEVVDIYLDNETGRPEWAVVRTGLFGLRSTFAPLAEATEVGDQVQIRQERALIKDAPNIEPDGQLSEAEEAELYRHYGLDYDTVVTDDATGQPAVAETDQESIRRPSGDPVPVGEGVSEPFVYETPGQPEVGVGTRHRQTGQVRLRRYLVTEVVTETASGQRHEVRVEREPIGDDDDWFRADGDPQR